jgi:hypothetical protein
VKKYLLAAAAALALGGTAYAQTDYDRGFALGYRAQNPNGLVPLPPLELPKLGQSEFEAGIVRGVNRANQDTGQHETNDNE